MLFNPVEPSFPYRKAEMLIMVKTSEDCCEAQTRGRCPLQGSRSSGNISSQCSLSQMDVVAAKPHRHQHLRAFIVWSSDSHLSGVVNHMPPSRSLGTANTVVWAPINPLCFTLMVLIPLGWFPNLHY